jgi:hypothetical protein
MLIPTWHRSYVRSHPIGLFVALGIALGGFFGLVFPSLVSDSAASLTLPRGVLTLFYVVWFLGGIAAFVGLLRGILRLHVSGMILIAGGLLAYYGVIVSIRGSGAIQALFIGLLGIGCGLHAWNLVRCGYDGVEHR